MDDGQEHDHVEQQVHDQHVQQRAGPGEQPALQQGERRGQQRSPSLVAELPEEGDEDDRLQGVRPGHADVPAQQREAGADEEQLVPGAHEVHAHEEPSQLPGIEELRPVPVHAGGEEVEGQDQPPQHRDDDDVALLQTGPAPPGQQREPDRPATVDQTIQQQRHGDGEQEHRADREEPAPADIGLHRGGRDDRDADADQRQIFGELAGDGLRHVQQLGQDEREGPGAAHDEAPPLAMRGAGLVRWSRRAGAIRRSSRSADHIMPPMPPIPPMPPMSSPPAAGAGSGLSATTASVVRNSPAIDPAFCSAERVTLTGSMMPALIRSSYAPVMALRPSPTGRLRTFSATTPPSNPALTAICLSGASTATLTMLAPVASSPSRLSLSKVSAPACSRDTPPPATTPSSTAALALRTASSMRCLRSLSSTSVAAPARMTATPPASFARRSCSFSRS